MVGKTLGHYEILEPLGAGGMGEVYRARDTTLKRDVAIKVLPADLADDPDRLARLEREAHLLAALNHPNIATIHSLEQVEATRFLVLELVKGESLAQRLAQGPLPTEAALDLCKQIAEALEAAHSEGIIHRDLKPANVLITPQGKAKVLDFGLAKVFEADASAGDLTQSPTLTVAGTQAGVILGTAPYMSPEQVRGLPLDKRVDIWAFGCVVYEALTASRAFARGTVADTLAAIIESEPDWGALPGATPPIVDALIKRCLRKDVDRRLHDIADARIEIEEALSGSTDAILAMRAAPTARGTRANPWKLAAPLAVASVLVGALGVWMTLPSSPSESLVRRFTIDYPPGPGFVRRTTLGVAISPDGSSVVFNAGGRLWLRSIGDLAATRIDGASNAGVPFFSPDGQQLGFWNGSDQMNVVSVAGGTPVEVGAASRVYGASWADDGTIYFGQGAGGIWRVQADGVGAPEVVIEMDDGEQAHGPQLLRGGEWLLFTVANTEDWNEAQIVVQSLLTGERKVLDIVGTDARYVPTGHLVYSRNGSLFAVPFDADGLDVTGAPMSINIDGVQQSARDFNNADFPFTGASQYAFSEHGDLVYMPASATEFADYRLVWVNREGAETEMALAPGKFRYPRLSADETRVALAVEADDRWQILVYDIGRDRTSPLTSEGSNIYPVWSPDGEWVYFDSNRAASADRDIWRRRVDRSEAAELVWQQEHRQSPWSFSADGESLLFFHPFHPLGEDISILRLGEPPTAETAVEDSRHPEGDVFNMFPSFSPDGRYFAYWGGAEVIAQEVSSGARWNLGQGFFPVWSRDGREIFYLNRSEGQSETMVVVAVDAGAEEPFSSPTPLFKTNREAGLFDRSFDVTADGQRFLMLARDTSNEEARPSQLVIVLNWFEELERLVPTQ